MKYYPNLAPNHELNRLNWMPEESHRVPVLDVPGFVRLLWPSTFYCPHCQNYTSGGQYVCWLGTVTVCHECHQGTQVPKLYQAVITLRKAP